jgi:nicotinamide mononucleotide transporter
MTNLISLIWLELQNLETIGVVFGIISVYLTVKENPWCWLLGIINIIIFGIIFYQSGIFGQFFLQVFFFILNVYGWYEWIYGKEENQKIKITRLKKKHYLTVFVILIFSTILIDRGIKFISEKENFTFLDSIITSISFVSQFFLARKIFESWILWIIVDILSIVLFIQTGLYKISFFYFILLILATSAYYYRTPYATSR